MTNLLRRLATIGFGLALVAPAVHAAECDVPLVAQTVAVPPNVMILMDSSGSMRESMRHPDYVHQNWSGDFTGGLWGVSTTGEYTPKDFDSSFTDAPPVTLVAAPNGRPGDYHANYLNWLFYHATDEQRAEAPQILRQDVQNAAVRYIIQNTPGIRFGLARLNGQVGATILSDAGSLTATLETQVDDMVADGWTPLGEALYDVYSYFSDPATSPIEYDCQANFVIMLTDGLPNNDDTFPSSITDADGDGFLDDVAAWTSAQDLRSDLDGHQDLSLYTIGFMVNNSLLEEAADAGGGFFREADDLDELTFELGTVLGDIVTRISAGSAVAVVSTETGDDSYLYRGKFMPGEWRGFLEAFELPYEDGDSPVWEAGQLLRSRDPSSRVIFTSFNGSIVELDASNVGTLKYAIAPNGPGSGSDSSDAYGLNDDNVFDAADQNLGPDFDAAYVEDVIAYVRGEDVEDTRDRSSWLLGDIVHSTPVVVGAPRSLSMSQGFQDFLTAHASRQRVVYVGANDGMLHAFHADTGEELWAYVPQNVLGSLEDLADPNYCHTAYVDLSPTVVDLELGGVWKTVIVGGLRSGGDAYFALDVTDPYAPDVLWETQVPDLVASFTEPVVIQTNVGTVLWTGSGPDADGSASVSAIDMKTGAIKLYEKVSSAAVENAATAPAAVDVDQDGYADFVYQADLAGDVWRFDLRTTNWVYEKIYDGSPTNPIQARPSLVIDDDGAVNVMFGTGRHLDTGDLVTTDQQYFIVLRDTGSSTTVGPGDLVSTTASSQDPITGPGWIYTLGARTGERVVEPAVAVEGVIYFTSFAPDDEECSAGGRSYLYTLDYRTGGAVDSDEDGDLNDETVYEDLGDGVASRPVVDLASGDVIVQTSDARLSVRQLKMVPQRIMVRGWQEQFSK